MVDKKLVDYIQKSFKRGSSISKAEKDLIMAGHDMDDVEAAGKIVRKKHFEKLGIMIISFVLFLALIAFLINFFRPEPVEPLPEMDLLEQAILDGDISACDQFGPAKRDICIRTINGGIKQALADVQSDRDYIAEAVKNNDSNACESIASPVLRKKCLIDIGVLKAPKTTNISVVQDSSGDENSSDSTVFELNQKLFDMAIEDNNPDICQAISSMVMRNDCLGRFDT